MHFIISRVSAVKKPDAPPARSLGYEGPMGEDIQTCDVLACREAAGAMMDIGLGNPRFTKKASCYEVIMPNVARMTKDACMALKRWPEAYIDFEQSRVVCIVNRGKPEL